MPPTLHPYLKRGLHFDASPIPSSDLVEDVPVEQDDTGYESAKRRRVEAIALQYLKGRPPLILTARLKGPFTKDWRNPWAQGTKADSDGRSKSMAGRVVEQRKRRSRAPPVASPEQSRAAAHTEDLCSQPDFEPLPATAPIPDEDEASGTTDFFSVDTQQFVANNSPTNPFWLRRPTASVTFPPNSQTDKSPTKPRKNDHRFDSHRSLQLAPPKEPLGRRPLPIRATPPDEWCSSASASMDISSAPRTVAFTKQAAEQHQSFNTSSTDIPDSSRLRADSAQEDEARSSQAAQNAQVLMTAQTPASWPAESRVETVGAHSAQPVLAQSFESLVPATTYKISNVVQVPQSSPSVLKADTQTSAQRLASLNPSSTKKQPSSPAICEPAKDIGLPKKRIRHNLVASPAPASSTGFAYRRVGLDKGENVGTAKPKPKAIDFSSSPASKKTCPSQVDAQAELQDVLIEAESAISAAPQTATEVAGEDCDKEDAEVMVHEAEDEDDQVESYKSKHSQYSTQAAMLLAQLEFQQDSSQSSSSASSATLRPWSQPAQNTTPPPLLPQPSPAMTPLSVFNARTDVSFSEVAGDGVLHGPPISTQDLFDAASPFAFSTVKKKSQRARRGSLLFALTSKLSEGKATKSSTPSAERVALKEKNTPTRWSSAHDKSLVHKSKLKLTSQSAACTSNDVELPQLDFHTSLDFGPTTDFTDYFLRGLNNNDEP